jgi:hypothetical protein
MKVEKIRVILGMILIPFLISIYLIDRLFSIPLIWISLPSINHWFGKENELSASIIRFTVLGSIYLIIYLIL